MTPRFTTYLATLILGAALLHGCLAAQLSGPTARACAEAQAAVEFCRADRTCSSATLSNQHQETWPVIEELQRNADVSCATHDAVVAGRLRR